ncbi:class I SAM-dependent methyltransferase [Patescibacteria group bacterium]|nr:class I SAM-dependent methyltransferase [Patescibacteria group bacterium]
MKTTKSLYSFCHYFLQFLTRTIKEEKRQIENSVLQKLETDNNRILDFGCGEGLFSNLFKNGKVKYFGADRDFDSINFAKKFHKLDSYVACNENLCFKDKMFAFIMLNNVLHHMSQKEVARLASEIKRVMQKKAFLIVIELAQRREQKGPLFRLVTYIENKIKKINYCSEKLLRDVFPGEFRKVYCEKIGKNFIIFIFANG